MTHGRSGRRGDRSAHPGEGRTVVENDALAGNFNAELAKDSRKVHWESTFTHALVKLGQHRDAHGAIALVERASEVPSDGNVAASREDRAQRIVERETSRGA